FQVANGCSIASSPVPHLYPCVHPAFNRIDDGFRTKISQILPQQVLMNSLIGSHFSV
ncbi:hypothetical protein V3C99_013247, partial [Haemonchus contortus]|uniref:Ovule protein n=1 Tax=Haemonchus contortus TaxID=6289 RepID=A0A7I5E6Y2_HAECO